MSSIGSVVAGSFYDLATGTVVQLNRVHQDSDFTMNGADEEDAAGSGIFLGEEASLELVFYDDDAAAIQQLVDWQDAETPLRFCLAGQRTNIVWDEDATITVRKTKTMTPMQRKVTTVTMTAKAKRLKIWQGVNLAHGFAILEGFDKGWADENSDNSPDGFAVPSVSTYDTIDFTNDVYTVGHNGDANFNLSQNRPFPISGVRLTLSVGVPKIHSNATNRLQILQQNFAAGVVATDLQTVSTTGRNSLVVTTQAGVYSIRLYYYELSSSASLDTAQIQFPALRADENAAYIGG